MPPEQNRKRSNATASLLVGISFFALASTAPELIGFTPDAGDDLVLGMYKALGGLCMLNGVFGYYRNWRQAERRKASAQTSGVFGTSTFATAEECEEAGLYDPRGLYLGLLDGEPIFYRGKAHLVTCAPARQGKGIGFVIPNLLHYTGSVVVTDPKGELAAVTAEHRRKRFGQDVAVFNPWALHDLPQHRINPLENLIALASDPAMQRGLTDEVKAVVMQLYPEPEDARNRYFREGARTILRAVLLYLALHAPKRCTLPEAWRTIANPMRLDRAVKRMRKSDQLGGIMADLGDDLAYQMKDNPEQFGDFRAGAVQQLAIYEPGGYLADAVSGSDISLADLKSGSASLYLTFPTERLVSHGAALGLIVNQAIAAVSRAKEQGSVLFLLDEFANMGKLSGLAESLTALPGLGVRVWMVVQELAELERLYGPHTARTVLSQAEVKQFFAVNDDVLAERLSKALGQRTVKTRNYNLGRFEDDDIGESLSETGRPLMEASEIKLMKAHEQLLLVNRLRPIRGEIVPFWFIAPWGAWAKPNPVEGDYPQEEPVVRLSYGLSEREAEEDEVQTADEAAKEAS